MAEATQEELATKSGHIYIFRTPRFAFHVDLLQNPEDCAYWFKRGTWMTGYRLSIGLFFDI